MGFDYEDDSRLPPITQKCPWCQSDTGFILREDSILIEPIGYRVECKSCYALGPIGNTKELAIYQWNKGFAIKKDKEFKPIFIQKER